MFALAAAAVAVAMTGIVSPVVMTGIVSPGHPLNMQTHVRYTKQDALRVFVYVNGREVGPSEGNNCVAYYYERGVTVRLASCGAGPLKVKAIAMRPAKIRVRSIKLP